jgi:release factor H-coupled RctB family protein
MGNSIQFIENGVRLIASKRNWIEGDTIEQLKHVSRLEGVSQVVGLPDLHPGRGYPIGAACFSETMIYPALVGNDIGCGMSLYETSIEARKVKQDKWEKSLRTKGFVNQAEWSEQGREIIEQRFRKSLTESQYLEMISLIHPFDHSLGTIGGGNHFAEFQRVSKIHDAMKFEALGCSSKAVFLLVHSGSRGLGEAILRQHVDRFGHKGLPSDSEEANAYMLKHDSALRWAEVNRGLIAARMCDALRLDRKPLLDVNHNLVSSESMGDLVGWLHRKGVTPADQGVVIIPGSRGSASYLVKPIKSDISLNSLAHGAGRKWIRSECEGRLRSRYKLSELTRTTLGSRVLCDDKALIYEEAPEAYKAIDIVVSDLVDAGLAEVIAELEPIMTYKTTKDAKNKGRCC